MGEEPTEMEAWLKRFASVREDARLNPAILRPSIPGFQPAPASQLGGGVASQVEAEGSFANAGDCLQGSDRTLESWVPQWLSLEFGEPSVVLTADEQSHSVTMADEMQVFRKKVDDCFGWSGKVLSEQQKQQRGAAQACLLLLEAGCDDGKSELLLCKVFTLIAGELFRSHGGQLFEYSNGAWAPASRGLTSVALEFILKALRRAQAYFGVMANDEDCKKQRCFDFVGFVVKVIQHVGGDEVLLQWQLQDVLPKKTELKAKHWAHGLSELCKVLRHQFDEHHRHSGSSLWGEELRESVLKVFHRWSDEDLSAKQQPGVCFRDAFISTVDGKLQQLKKDARHGCYVSVPAHLLYQPSVESRRRYAGIILSAFAGSNGLKVLLDQCALIVARVRQPCRRPADPADPADPVDPADSANASLESRTGGRPADAADSANASLESRKCPTHPCLGRFASI
eukprot:s482_g22.t1